MYQIDSRKVDDYLKIMDDKLNEYEELLANFENKKNNLKWEGRGATAAKDACQKVINEEIEFINIIRIYMLVYKKGIEGYRESLSEIEKEFMELLEEKELLKKVAMRDV